MIALLMHNTCCVKCVQGDAQCRLPQALNQAGLLGEHSPTHVMELNPRTLSDVMDSILQARTPNRAHQSIITDAGTKAAEQVLIGVIWEVQ